MPGKVLLADDSLNIQKTVTQLLKEAGIEVAAFSNGEHAVRKLGDVKPDLILADVFMPVRTGFEVCEYVKDSDQFSHIPVLLLASSMEPFDEREAQRVRADGRLTKPFSDPAALVNTVKQWLEKSAKAKPPEREHAPAIEEFAAAVPAAEPEPEPAFEEFSTRPPVVTFEKQEAPLGFTDVLEAQVEAPAPEPPAEVSAEELPAASLVEEPAAMVPEPEPVEAPAAPLEWPAPTAAPEPPPEPAPPAVEEALAGPQYQVEKPELASPWEMTGPPPGAPEISTGGWDSQWKGVPAEEAAPAVEAPAEVAPAAPPGAPGFEQPADRFEPSEFAAALAAAEQATAGVVAATPAPPAGATQTVDPAVVDAVVKEVMQRLSPQVIEQITREIVRPLAETLLKEKRQP